MTETPLHEDTQGRSHAELWLDFAQGIGGDRHVRNHEPLTEVQNLVSFFHRVAREGTPAEALASFYAYESQVPQVAAEKARGLREYYAASDTTRAYFTLHTTADVGHTRVWRHQLEKQLSANPTLAAKALAAGEAAAQALWHALDGIEERRQTRTVQTA